MELVNQRRRWTVLGFAVFNLLTFQPWLGSFAAPAEAAAETKLPAIQLPDLLELLKTNLSGATPEELNRAAVSGLLQQLAPRVTLLDDPASAPRKTDQARSTIPEIPGSASGAPTTTSFERAYGYVRIPSLNAETARLFQSAVDGLASSNKLRGLIVDLRFSGGTDNSAAVAVADLFFGHAQELADWGVGPRKSSAKSNYFTWPTMVIVNRQTSGAAEVLAGILRHGDVGLLVGTNTAGQAGMTKDFTLKTGQKLRVVVAPVKVLQGQELPFSGIKPDIEVGVEPDEERLYLADAYRVTKATGTSPMETAATSATGRSRRRMNEAELVRLTREGQDPREITGAPAAPGGRTVEPLSPSVTDPALARALDILKGLTVVQRFRGP